ncbi:MAG: 3-hydroxyacyl-CoA dehydrogenase family protein [Bacteroidales bacterium]|nr:3-hydroxyacyl-CoA dehydrogenase family protein [Bacteroidales bacterium]
MPHDTKTEDPSCFRHPASGIRNVGIIGEGKMGSSIFYSLVNQPYHLRWIGSTTADIDRLSQNFQKKIRRAQKTGMLSQAHFDLLSSQTIISSDLRDASDCDLIIEAIPEEVLLKQDLFKRLDLIVKPSTILASNSSSINPSILFTGTHRDHQIIGIHYFYPVILKESVELTFTLQTAAEARENARLFLQNTHKRILELDESNSFILNRLFLDIQNEAYRICEQGIVSEEQIDQLVKEHLFPVGIFEFMDSVGIDILLNSIRNYVEAYPNKEYYSGLVSRLQKLVDDGKTGKKTGQGFYLYKDSLPVIPVLSQKLSHKKISEIIEFMKYTYLNTAKRFTMQSGCTIGEMNLAIKEYLGLEKGPFE